jgi:hypothetical protein
MKKPRVFNWVAFGVTGLLVIGISSLWYGPLFGPLVQRQAPTIPSEDLSIMPAGFCGILGLIAQLPSRRPMRSRRKIRCADPSLELRRYA